ncbi:MAG: class I SAM-dependent methyltransferase [Planctomycetota bacterium]|jgi:SAM-dependent methyltransferase
MEVLKFVVPGKTQEDEVVAHTNRYNFARRYVKGKRVLDAGCGAGYGSQIMLDAGAKKVIGIDIDKDALVYAKSHYNGKFLNMDITNMKFKKNSFDVVVSFEVISVSFWQEAIDEIKRVLKNRGLFISSNPVMGYSRLEDWRQSNVIRAPLFSKDELMSKFQNNFSNTRFYGQGKVFFAFPGRGMVSKVLGIKRNHDIVSLKNSTAPRAIISVGTVRK